MRRGRGAAAGLQLCAGAEVSSSERRAQQGAAVLDEDFVSAREAVRNSPRGDGQVTLAKQV